MRHEALFFLILALAVPSCGLFKEDGHSWQIGDGVADHDQSAIQAFRDGPLREDYTYYFSDHSEDRLERLYADLVKLEDGIVLSKSESARESYRRAVLTITESRAFLDLEFRVRREVSDHESLERLLGHLSEHHAYTLTAATWLNGSRSYLSSGSTGRSTACFKRFVDGDIVYGAGPPLGRG